MEQTDFKSRISVRIDASEAIRKISNVPGWWGVTFSGKSEKQGDQFEIKMGGDSFFHVTVEELIPNKRLVWFVRDCNMPWYADKQEWANTRLIFDLSDANGMTAVTFTHKGLTPNIECYKDCAPGWKHWIETSLHSYLTTGSGVFRPSTAPEL